MNLVVLRSTDIDRAARFYAALELVFTKHRHGAGPEHYACKIGCFVFEIYPRQTDADTRVGFRVMSVDKAVAALEQAGARIV